MEPRLLRRYPEHKLHNAVMLGWTKTVHQLLDRGANVNSAGKYGATPLMLAVMWKRPVIAKLLLERGADVHAKNAAGHTAAEMIAEGDEEMTDLLARHGK
jgi:uncharacterized protein